MAVDWLPVRTAARQLGVHENTVRNMAADGRLSARKGPGGTWQIASAAVARHHAREVDYAAAATRAAIDELRATVRRASRYLALIDDGGN